MKYDRKSNPSKFGKSSNGSKISSKVWQDYQIKLEIFLTVIHKKLQFKGTELDLNGIELAENLKVAKFTYDDYLPLLLHDLRYLRDP